MLDLTQLKKTPATANAAIFDTTGATFERDVLQASMQKPVIVEFWATWCGPCKQLMPILEKEVTATNGAVLMAKVDIDKNPDLAQALRVQSVPMVYAFYQGQPVDGFLGVRSPSEIKTFITKLLGLAGTDLQAPQDGPVVDKVALEKFLVDAHGKFKSGATEEAMAAYSNALDIDPDSMAAMAGLCWCLIALKDTESVSEIFSQLDDAKKAAPEIAGVAKVLGFANTTQDLEDVAALAARVLKNPKDLQARYDLSLQYLAALDIEAAIDALVDLTRADREWQEQKARTLLLSLFDALGAAHPLTGQGRRKLSAVLFS